ncbi:MAG: GTP cyclohydrolase FolE2 [Candidatus Thorarchaeota archaeon]
MKSKECLPDIQCSPPNINIPIKQVGVENVEVPFKLEFRSGGFIQLNANVSMRTDLDKNTKGISMSRLLLTLKPYLDLPLKQTLIKQILEDLKKNIGSESSFMKFSFRMPIMKQSITSDNEFPIYYKCRFEGQLIGEEYKFFQGVIVQYASYCPCSAELCDHLGNNSSKGFPHNQRSFADVLVEVEPPSYIWLEDIIETVETKIKTLPYPIIKRVDEQEIARIAAENPIFVEDAIRLISEGLNEMPLHDWIVKCTHEESIHTSEAISVNWKGISNGFNGRRFL